MVIRKYKTDNYRVVGVMSGTSCDGLDLAFVEYAQSGKMWSYSILDTTTIQYSDEMRQKLKEAHHLSGLELSLFDFEYGRFIGEHINRLVRGILRKPDIIASHGHTVFHEPKIGLTRQIGHGQAIAEKTGIKTVTDFRTKDVLSGGQGAPLVPVGDKLLFPEYAYCLNLGGFANITLNQKWSLTAFDVCPVNMALNYLCPPFDDNGRAGSRGKVYVPLLDDLMRLKYYKEPPPKTLGREWFESVFLPALKKHEIPESDILRTVYEHIALQIAAKLEAEKLVLVTGGGAYNNFLTELITKRSASKIIIPEPQLIEFKEAVIFGLLGVLRILNLPNCLASVTGAKQNICAGIIYEA